LNIKICHLIPAAGRATRLSGIPKFLLPLPKHKNILSYHLNFSSKISEIDSVKIATNSSYLPIIKGLESIENYEKLEKIKLVNTNTMNKTIHLLKDKLHEYYLLTMPDTYFTDEDVLSKMISKISEDNSIDVVLGLWSIKEFQRSKIGQCKLRGEKVIEVIDKDPKSKFKYLWGAILFKKNLWSYINTDDPHIGYSLNPALQNSLNISYVKADGVYYDCGTIEEYWRMVKEI
jgi:hypothetical protein